MFAKARRKLERERRLYIVPTTWGLLFLSTVVVMILTAATYANNLIFLLAFFLFALFVISMLQTHDNLRGVEIEPQAGAEAFAGEPFDLGYTLSRADGRAASDLRVRPRSKLMRTLEDGRADLAGDGAGARAVVRAVIDRRGVYALPEVSLETRFPHHMFRAWTVLRPAGEVLIFPPKRGARELPVTGWRGGPAAALNGAVTAEGDFGELVPHRAGDAFSRIAWKHYARTRQLMRATYWGAARPHYRIDGRAGTEAELEQVSRWIEVARERNASFEVHGLDRELGPGEGDDLARASWRALARAKVGPV